MNPPEENSQDDTGTPSSSSRLRRLLDWNRRRAAFDARDLWWRFQDLLEEERWFRRATCSALVLVVVGAATWIWVYPWWHQRNALHIARGWLAAGRPDHAAEAVQEALKAAPLHPESWQLASEIAQLLGNKPAALAYARQAAKLRPNDLQLDLEWASRALLADKLDEAETALRDLPRATLSQSAPALRVAGELARRQLHFSAARDFFEEALRLDGPGAIDEVPLGIVLINSRDPAERQRGLDLLARWASDLNWGPAALRPLLEDAMLHNDTPAMLRWAEILRTHPLCTARDMPRCLLALSRAEPSRCATVLNQLETAYAPYPVRIVTLIGWLNEIGRSDEAVRWSSMLPSSIIRRAPAVVAIAESLRLSAAWTALAAWTDGPPWDDDIEFLRLCYRLQTALKADRTDEAGSNWSALQTIAQRNAAHALFAGDTLITWGLDKQAVSLWWIATGNPGVAIKALGTLARHYQVQHDADGQYRAFRKLYSLRTNNPSIANNLAFFATLTGKNDGLTDRLALKNFKADPDNLIFRATYAFVLCQEGQKTDALALLKPFSTQAKTSPALAFAYGLTLAGTGHKTEAHALLDPLDKESLTTAEVTLLANALN